jgi:hypothetical protein
MIKIGIGFIGIILVAIFFELTTINHTIASKYIPSNNSLADQKKEPQFGLVCRKGSVIAVLGKKEQKMLDNYKNPLACSYISLTETEQGRHFTVYR